MMPEKNCGTGSKVLGKNMHSNRSIDVDDKDYIELFLDHGYDEETAADDFGSGIRGWWSNEWVPSDWMESDKDYRS